MSQALSEFDLIARFFDVQALTGNPLNPSIPLSIGDDCALLSPAPGYQLAVSVDTLVAGVHFPLAAPPERLGWRALAVSVSDLAAMGARPLGFTLALTLPMPDSAWLEAFSAGLAAASQHYGIVLVGGDTTQGPLSLSLQVMGEVPAGQALRRDGAKEGDGIYVTGSLGAAHLALDYLNQQGSLDPRIEALLSAYYEPASCITFGQSLRGIASAAVDISDGLLADIGHIAKRSQLAVLIDSSAIPIHPVVKELSSSDRALYAASRGGDDYQLAFCVPEAHVEALLSLPFQVTKIGRCQAGSGVFLDGAPVHVGGYQHFEVSDDNSR